MTRQTSSQGLDNSSDINWQIQGQGISPKWHICFSLVFSCAELETGLHTSSVQRGRKTCICGEQPRGLGKRPHGRTTAKDFQKPYLQFIHKMRGICPIGLKRLDSVTFRGKATWSPTHPCSKLSVTWPKVNSLVNCTFLHQKTHFKKKLFAFLCSYIF